MTPVLEVTGSTTSMLVSLALNAATAKHVAIAQNIANVNNEGYRPLQVDFDQQVALFKHQLLNPRNDAASARLIETLQSATEVKEADASGNSKVLLDVEMAKMAQNALHYQALLAAKGKLSSMVRMAISGGR
jgi:flagellar basal-body rod protein FlgB